jgi:hypothetical protein
MTQPPTTANPSLTELLAASRFTKIHPGYQPEHVTGWRDLGDRIRGELIALRPAGRLLYRLSELSAILAEESRRLGRTLLPATTYELIHFAAQGWEQSISSITAHGSSWTDSEGQRHLPYLFGVPRRINPRRELSLFSASGETNQLQSAHILYAVL